MAMFSPAEEGREGQEGQLSQSGSHAGKDYTWRRMAQHMRVKASLLSCMFSPFQIIIFVNRICILSTACREYICQLCDNVNISPTTQMLLIAVKKHCNV